MQMGKYSSKYNEQIAQPKDECAVVGMLATASVQSHTIFRMLNSLQHRGQESSGIFTICDSGYKIYKDMGLVSQVYDNKTLENMQGNVIIGHNRYSTSGTSTLDNAQPIHCTSKAGTFALAHNGNIIINEESSTQSDTHHLINSISASIDTNYPQLSIEECIRHVLKKCKGAYSLVIAFKNMLIAARDPNGIRPLCLGMNKDQSFIVSSETCALDAIDAKFMRDISPGEILVIKPDNEITSLMTSEQTLDKLCVLELIYFSRPDSLYKDSNIYNYRYRMGIELAKNDTVIADIVIPIPSSGTIAALGYSAQSGIPFCEAINENKYTGRTFIQPTQEDRIEKIRNKFNIVKDLVIDKRIVIVDDSIVRGNTCKCIVQMLRKCGAKEIHIRISSPPLKYPCFYGIDIDNPAELIAYDTDKEAILNQIMADSLEYLSIKSLRQASGENNSFCEACFTGKYLTDNINLNLQADANL